MATPSHEICRIDALGFWWLWLILAALPASGDESVAPYVPTVEEDVELMLDVGAVAATDYVIDLGSGDGRIVIAAARRGAHGHGVELDAELVELARQNAADAEVADRVAFLEGDIFAADISEASVVTLYLFPEANIALRPKLLAELRPGTRVLSNSFTMGDWVPDAHDLTARSSGGILLWIIPAKVAGAWTLELDGMEPGYRLNITQQYQELELKLTSGTMDSSAAPGRWRPGEARLRGDRVSFSLTDGSRTLAFIGRVEGNAMQGVVQLHTTAGTRMGNWRASRR